MRRLESLKTQMLAAPDQQISLTDPDSRSNEQGQFDASADVGRSLRQDVKRKAKTVVKAGQGDKGDQKRRD
jgi:hypothetical protein